MAAAPSYPGAIPPVAEKQHQMPQPPPESSSYLSAIYQLTHPLTRPVANTYNRFESWKDSMGLYQPGTAENLTREIKRECTAS